MRKVITGLLVGFSWLLLFFSFHLITEFVLVPWDTAVVRPEVGTWQRSLNDFFEVAPGSLLLGSLAVLLSVWLSRPLWSQGVAALLRLTITNILLALLLCFGVVAAFMLVNWLNPYPPVRYDPTYHGYHRSLLPFLVSCCLVAVWLRWHLVQRSRLLA